MVQNYFINVSCLTSPGAGFQSLQSFVFTRLQLNSLDRMTILTPWGQREAPCPWGEFRHGLEARVLHTHALTHTPTPHGPPLPSSTCERLLSLYGQTPWASTGQSCQSCLLQNWILNKNIDFLLCKTSARQDFHHHPPPPFNAINWGRGWGGCDTKEQNRFQTDCLGNTAGIISTVTEQWKREAMSCTYSVKLKLVNHKETLLHSTGTSTQCSMVTKWEGNARKRGYMCTYCWFTLLYGRN